MMDDDSNKNLDFWNSEYGFHPPETARRILNNVRITRSIVLRVQYVHLGGDGLIKYPPSTGGILEF